VRYFCWAKVVHINNMKVQSFHLPAISNHLPPLKTPFNRSPSQRHHITPTPSGDFTSPGTPGFTHFPESPANSALTQLLGVWLVVVCLMEGTTHSQGCLGWNSFSFPPGYFLGGTKDMGKMWCLLKVCVCVCGNFSNNGRYQVNISWRTEDSVGMFFLIFGK